MSSRRKRLKTQAPDVPLSEPVELNPFVAAIALVAALAFPILVRLRLVHLPLERDEGEYAYAGQLMLDGIPPYQLVFNMKFPGIYAAYAAMMGVFGETVAGIRIGVLVLTTVTAILLYFLAARLFGRLGGVVAAAAFGLLALTPDALGIYGHATHFISPFVVAALILLLGELTPLRLLSAGALLAGAVLMKQPAVVFGAFALLYVWLVSRKRVRDAGLLVAGGAIVGALTAMALVFAGVFERFWFWCVHYAREYVTTATLAEGLGFLGTNLGRIIAFAPAIWLVAAAGLVFVLQRGAARERWLVVGFAIAAFLATTPGLYFRSHYFIVMFPAVALLAGAAVRLAPRTLPRHAAPIAAAVAILITIALAWPVLMEGSDEAITRHLYGHNPFPESPKIAEYLREKTQPGERLVILGSEPQIYFHADRKSATGYIYAYPLMEPQRYAGEMQDEMIRQIQAANPRYLVFVGTPSSWLRQERSDLRILEWFRRESKSGRWQLDGIVDIAEPSTEYVWGAAAQTYRPRTENFILLYRRL